MPPKRKQEPIYDLKSEWFQIANNLMNNALQINSLHTQNDVERCCSILFAQYLCSVTTIGNKRWKDPFLLRKWNDVIDVNGVKSTPAWTLFSQPQREDGKLLPMHVLTNFITSPLYTTMGETVITPGITPQYVINSFATRMWELVGLQTLIVIGTYDGGENYDIFGIEPNEDGMVFTQDQLRPMVSAEEHDRWVTMYNNLVAETAKQPVVVEDDVKNDDEDEIQRLQGIVGEMAKKKDAFQNENIELKRQNTKIQQDLLQLQRNEGQLTQQIQNLTAQQNQSATIIGKLEADKRELENGNNELAALVRNRQSNNQDQMLLASAQDQLARAQQAQHELEAVYQSQLNADAQLKLEHQRRQTQLEQQINNLNLQLQQMQQQMQKKNADEEGLRLQNTKLQVDNSTLQNELKELKMLDAMHQKTIGKLQFDVEAYKQEILEMKPRVKNAGIDPPAAEWEFESLPPPLPSPPHTKFHDRQETQETRNQTFQNWIEIPQPQPGQLTQDPFVTDPSAPISRMAPTPRELPVSIKKERKLMEERGQVQAVQRASRSESSQVKRNRVSEQEEQMTGPQKYYRPQFDFPEFLNRIEIGSFASLMEEFRRVAIPTTNNRTEFRKTPEGELIDEPYLWTLVQEIEEYLLFNFGFLQPSQSDLQIQIRSRTKPMIEAEYAILEQADEPTTSLRAVFDYYVRPKIIANTPNEKEKQAIKLTIQAIIKYTPQEIRQWLNGSHELIGWKNGSNRTTNNFARIIRMFALMRAWRRVDGHISWDKAVVVLCNTLIDLNVTDPTFIRTILQIYYFYVEDEENMEVLEREFDITLANLPEFKIKRREGNKKRKVSLVATGIAVVGPVNVLDEIEN